MKKILGLEKIAITLILSNGCIDTPKNQLFYSNPKIASTQQNQRPDIKIQREITIPTIPEYTSEVVISKKNYSEEIRKIMPNEIEKIEVIYSKREKKLNLEIIPQDFNLADLFIEQFEFSSERGWNEKLLDKLNIKGISIIKAQNLSKNQIIYKWAKNNIVYSLTSESSADEILNFLME